jgi:hypothetical protein
MVPVIVATLLVIGSGLVPPSPLAVSTVPDEDDAFFLPEAPTIQAVAADLDGDGSPEIVRLVRGTGTAIDAEAWADRDDGWERIGSVVVVPASPPGGPVVSYAGAPARLVVRHIGAVERVSLVRQPLFRELDLQPSCCLLVADLEMLPRPRLVPVIDPAGSVDAVFVIDLDGDGIDELVTTRSLPPLSDISFPSEAALYRWSGSAFSPPVVTELRIGSRDTPFILGDTDGRPGEELGLITSIGTRTLHRISLVAGDQLATEDSGIAVDQVLAVDAGAAGPGLAILARGGALTVRTWPSDGQISEPLGAASRPGAMIVGTVGSDAGSLLLTRATRRDSALLAMRLPDLDRAGEPLEPSPAALRALSGQVAPFVGDMPDLDHGGSSAVIFDGWLVSSQGGELSATAVAAFVRAAPLGQVGRGGRWIAFVHGVGGGPVADPRGGRLEPPVSPDGAGISLLATARMGAEAERDDGRLEPQLTRTAVIDPTGGIATGPDGFEIRIGAPVGSRVYVQGTGPPVGAAVSVVPEGGQVSLDVRPQNTETDAAIPVALAVVTPGGRTYVASWDVRVLRGGPPLTAGVETPFGSTAVRVEGRTVRYAQVRVGGALVEVEPSGRFAIEVPVPPWPTDITVVATDPIGHRTTVTVSGVSLFDYRTLPWLAIVSLSVAAAGVALYLRVPPPRPESRRATDDAVLEEVEPD